MAHFTYKGVDFHFGWVYDPAGIEQWASQRSAPTLAQAAPHLSGTGANQDVFYWELEEKILGKRLPSWDQGQLGSCFPAGTLITMADGSVKPIEQVVLRDVVLTAEGNTGEVTNLFSRHYKGSVYRLSAGGHNVEATSDHPILTKNGYLPIHHLTKGSVVALSQKGKGPVWVEVRSVTQRYAEIPVYNFEVQGDNSYVANGIGVHNCVSHGSGRAAQDLLLVQIALGNEGWEGHEVAREPIYGGSRVQAGHDGGGGDGSTGTWAADWLTQWGIVLYGPNGLDGTYNITRCRQWGNSGVPQQYQETAKKHPLKTAAQVTTAAQARDAIANGYPVSICGDVSRTMQRQKNGFCPRTGDQWAHCQELCGVCIVKGGTPAFVYRNSWGDYLGSTNNTVQLESGRTVTLPDGVYLSDFDSVERDLRQGDSFSYAHATGWPAQTLSWYV